MILSGWGRYPAVECQVKKARDISDISHLIANSGNLIARGNGRAYGDAAINRDATISMTACDRFLNFDPVSGIIECEAGVLLSDLLRLTVPRGWFPPVVPGTKFVTIGGLIAADVHGKNHHLDGSFGRHVESFRLAMADGTILNCSPTEHSDVFAATIGGMGLTGIIVSATIRLRRVESEFIDETIIRAESLKELLQLIDVHNDATYSVAWIDSLARGSQFGRGILMLGEHAAMGSFNSGRNNSKRPRSTRLSIPVELPISPLNRWTTKLFNELYYNLKKPSKQRVQYDGFFFPLDAVLNWNRIYGRRGFVQYQCVLPEGEWDQGLPRLLEIVSELGNGSFLTVLKKLGPGNGYISFPMGGYTITFDFPVNTSLMSGLEKLDAVVDDHKGRIYLAKDARAPRHLIEKGYPEIEAFRQLRRSIDPELKFRSVLSERLGL